MKLLDLLRANSQKSINERNASSAALCIRRAKEEAERASLNCTYEAKYDHPDLKYADVQHAVRKALEAEGLKVIFSSGQFFASSDTVTYFVKMSWK
jgi:hypothetical protein